MSQSKIWLKEDDFIQFELKKMQIFLKLSIMSWQGTKSKNYQSPFSNLLQEKLTKSNYRKIQTPMYYGRHH